MRGALNTEGNYAGDNLTFNLLSLMLGFRPISWRFVGVQAAKLTFGRGLPTSYNE